MVARLLLLLPALASAGQRERGEARYFCRCLKSAEISMEIRPFARRRTIFCDRQVGQALRPNLAHVPAHFAAQNGGANGQIAVKKGRPTHHSSAARAPKRGVESAAGAPRCGQQFDTLTISRRRPSTLDPAPRLLAPPHISAAAWPNRGAMSASGSPRQL